MFNKTFKKPQSSTSTIRDLTLTSLLIALVFVSTKFINIQLPISINGGGLIHLGNPMLFVAAIVFGKKKGAFAGAFGMALFDLLSPYVIWAPFTFVIRGVMGYLIGLISWKNGKNGNSLLYNIIAIVVSGIWMILGYYITQVILYGNWISPVFSIPGDATQIVIGAVLGLPLASALKRTKAFN